MLRSALVFALTSSFLARADDGHRLDLFAGADLLLSPAARGGAVSAGVTWSPLPHLAIGADLGYGLLHAAGYDEDRWWLIPTVALRVPLGATLLDLGAGLGVGTVSGYPSWSDYFAQPFNPTWHVTTWALRGHAHLAVPMTPRLALFGRAELGAVLEAPPTASEALWFGLSAGVQFAAL